MKSGRCKIVRVSADAIMTLMGNWRRSDFISLPTLKGLPGGYEVVACEFDFAYQGFSLLIHHESFPEVGAGLQYPAVDGFAEWETAEIPDSMKRRDAVKETAVECLS